jgi:hypothetical protein
MSGGCAGIETLPVDTLPVDMQHWRHVRQSK